MENLDTSCVDDVHQKTFYKPFLVKSKLGWLEDRLDALEDCLIVKKTFFRSLRLECVLFEDKQNVFLNNYKSKLRKANDINRNKVIYSY